MLDALLTPLGVWLGVMALSLLALAVCFSTGTRLGERIGNALLTFAGVLGLVGFLPVLVLSGMGTVALAVLALVVLITFASISLVALLSGSGN